jgi:hypothetical protein
MSNVIMPPSRIYAPAGNISVFLAGSIDMGQAVNWQEIVSDMYRGSSVVTIYNPRRDDWDSSWEQKLECGYFTEQVNWELDFMDKSDFVFLFISKDSKAPITLLEFGRITAKYPEKLVICVEPGFWRRGNIEVMCNREGIELHEDLKGAMIELSQRIAHRVQNKLR